MSSAVQPPPHLKRYLRYEINNWGKKIVVGEGLGLFQGQAPAITHKRWQVSVSHLESEEEPSVWSEDLIFVCWRLLNTEYSCLSQLEFHIVGMCIWHTALTKVQRKLVTFGEMLQRSWCLLGERILSVSYGYMWYRYKKEHKIAGPNTNTQWIKKDFEVIWQDGGTCGCIKTTAGEMKDSSGVRQCPAQPL